MLVKLSENIMWLKIYTYILFLVLEMINSKKIYLCRLLIFKI
jgi:hypothetical protein